MHTDSSQKQVPGYRKSELLTLETQSTGLSSGGAITPTSDIESVRDTFNIVLRSRKAYKLEAYRWWVLTAYFFAMIA